MRKCGKYRSAGPVAVRREHITKGGTDEKNVTLVSAPGSGSGHRRCGRGASSRNRRFDPDGVGYARSLVVGAVRGDSRHFDGTDLLQEDDRCQRGNRPDEGDRRLCSPGGDGLSLAPVQGGRHCFHHSLCHFRNSRDLRDSESVRAGGVSVRRLLLRTLRLHRYEDRDARLEPHGAGRERGIEPRTPGRVPFGRGHGHGRGRVRPHRHLSLVSDPR